MGTHGRWRKEQHAEAEVCGKEGACWRAYCAARGPMKMNNLGVISEEVSDSIITEEMRHSHLRKGSRVFHLRNTVYTLGVGKTARLKRARVPSTMMGKAFIHEFTSPIAPHILTRRRTGS